MTYPICPVCRLPIRPRHELALAMRAVAIPVRDAHEKLNQPTARRDSQWALGRLDEAKAIAEAHEESCACTEQDDSRAARLALAHVATYGFEHPDHRRDECPVESGCRHCKTADIINAALGTFTPTRIDGDGFSIAGPSVPPGPETLRDAVASQSGE